MVNRFNTGKRLVCRHGLRNRLALINLPMVHCLPLDFAKAPLSVLFFSWDDCNETPKKSGNNSLTVGRGETRCILGRCGGGECF